MAQKNVYAEALKRNGLNKLTWVVIAETDGKLIGKNRITGLVKAINK